MNIQNKIKAVIRKNVPELKALLTWNLPSFVYGYEVKKGTVPVFVFHEVDADSFEAQLSYLKKNGYTTLDASELFECLKEPNANHAKKVVLTFDDGHISLWQHAFPLLKKYDFKGVSFVCPGLVPDDQVQGGKNQERKLCSWGEINQMHGSGHVDFQSHGMYHDLVFVSDKLIDFYSPEFSSSYIGKHDQVVVLHDDSGFSMTNLWPYETNPSAHRLGMPIFEHLPRFEAKKRYSPSVSSVDQICYFVREQGGKTFFERKNWRKVLSKVFFNINKGEGNRPLNIEKYEEELASVLCQSRDLLGSKLKGKKVEHFCCPWYLGTEIVTSASAKAGCRTIHYGFHSPNQSLDQPLPVLRLPEKFLYCLPGLGRRPFWAKIFFRGSQRL